MGKTRHQLHGSYKCVSAGNKNFNSYKVGNLVNNYKFNIGQEKFSSDIIRVSQSNGLIAVVYCVKQQ